MQTRPIRRSALMSGSCLLVSATTAQSNDSDTERVVKS